MRLGVIGGGLAGLVCSLVARRMGMQVLLFETSGFDCPRAGEHLAAEAVELLKSLGVSADVFEQAATPCNEILSYWGSNQPYERDALQNVSGLGLLLTRPAFDELFAQFVCDAGVQIVSGARVTHLEHSGASWSLCSHQNARESWHAVDFIVDASGRNSRFASTLGFHKIKYDKLTALNIRFPLTADVNTLWEGRVVVEPHSQGWIYAAGLGGATGILSVVMESENLDRTRPMGDFITETLARTKHLRALAAALEGAEDVMACSCQSQASSQMIGDRWLLVGDAAWSADPLSAQGMLKAIQDGIAAAHTIDDHHRTGGPALASYQAGVRGNFRTYLLEREKYYRREHRWPDSQFWRSRHRCTIPAHAITLDPQQVLDFSAVNLSRVVEHVTVAVPMIEPELLAAIAQHPAAASEMVAQYRQRTETSITDREIILALQAAQQWVASN